MRQPFWSFFYRLAYHQASRSFIAYAMAHACHRRKIVGVIDTSILLRRLCINVWRDLIYSFFLSTIWHPFVLSYCYKQIFDIESLRNYKMIREIIVVSRNWSISRRTGRKILSSVVVLSVNDRKESGTWRANRTHACGVAPAGLRTMSQSASGLRFA